MLEATLADQLRIWGIFEDAAQRDFHRGLLDTQAATLHLSVHLDWRKTDGCNFEYLREHFQETPLAMKDIYGQIRSATRPGHAKTEREAKARLGSWIEDLLGDPLLQGGREHAELIGRLVDVHRLGATRCPELQVLLRDDLPAFLKGCRKRTHGGPGAEG